MIAPQRFAGTTAMITGGVQGIGRAVAERLRAESAEVVLVDRSEAVHEVAAELGAHGVVADLEEFSGATAAAERAVQLVGRIDVLINNVGGTIWAKPYEHYAEDEVRAEVQRSLFPTLWCCRAVLPHMLDRGSGTIVNVSSVATRGVNRVPYGAAKGGVNALTTSLAMEVAERGIRVVATATGGTEAPPRRIPRGPGPDGDRERGWFQQVVDQTTDSSLMKRYGTLAEQAGAIAFLASAEASYVTGTVLPVAGGDLG
ncbi:1,6-dihydroxycyclohexa-2,4-diene-1-carboxylate dehydrogenase [Saccharopolyspora sp. HNM0983]|uniref:1,6-dihydroxycyclohexa-2,4-diene-1-carboxylate dehydrogenase n=1 Tax=Saccharopolyspora montiporae TaxID=2781240 RepID=A0A929BAE7_9PSEU|nr:1,6-dihydroxycyclohexa-2,4-diene-1-carboxylate dehydrogenase [Saccharopolyspora sp. HNM0983]MBE9375196.1 1,6-dihydroxycyclohexa-2,4-diene-1-carboxylate dehydrogenase [Saccharopolyspora sp. HNM0983]